MKTVHSQDLLLFLIWSDGGLVCLFFSSCHYFSDQSDKRRYCLAGVLPQSPATENDNNTYTKINILAFFSVELLFDFVSALKWPPK